MKVLVTVVIAGCVAHVDGPRLDALPFAGAPAVGWTDAAKIEVAVALQRDVTPADNIAFVIRVADAEVGRYPIVGLHGASVHQPLDLPIGDYDLAIDYQGQRYAGDPFRVAMVPEWGGTRQLHVFRNHGTRISLRDHKLWILRWWANDTPAQSWIVEWRHDGHPMTTTSGREQRWNAADASAFIRNAHATGARRSIWQLGEEYVVPDVVATTPGAWEARVVHEGTGPVAIAFTVAAGGAIGEAATELFATPAGWSHAWSKPLVSHTLAAADAAELAGQLPVITGEEPIDAGSIQLTPNAVRALFRSKQLADSWFKFLDVGSAEKTALRPKIEQLIRSNGGPWKPDELPKS